MKRAYYFETPIYYPFPFTNFHRYKWLFKHSFKHAILDCGVEIFWRETDYPKGFLEKYKWKAKQLNEIFHEKLWIVIPDYCDDYKHVPNNVEKTLRNIKDFMKIKEVNWLPVIQSRYLDIYSFYESIERTKEIIGDNYPRIAIGTVCKTKKLDFIEECMKAARKHFPNSWIHAFGLTLNALPRVADLLDSFDTSSYTFKAGSKSCGTIKERIEYFQSYHEKVKPFLKERDDLNGQN